MSERRSTAIPQADVGDLVLWRGLLLFAPIALLGDKASSLLQYPEIGAAVLYLPYAVLTAVLVLAPRRDWVWYVLAAALSHFLTHWPRWTLSWVLIATVANIARALVAAALLRRLFGRAPRIDSIPALLTFVAAAALLAPAVGATIGAANMALHGEPFRYWSSWRAWFMSNALTGLTVLPGFLWMLTTALTARGWRLDRARATEALLLTAALATACVVAFLVPHPPGSTRALLLYLPLPVLIWVALRFGSGAASLALTTVVVAAIWGADRGTAPFLAASQDQQVFALQLFVFLTTLPVFCIAAIGGARQNAVQLYRALLASVEDHVAILDARGIVLEVNASWQQFVDEGQRDRYRPVGAGDDFLGACRSGVAAGEATAVRVLAGVMSVLSREQRRIELEYEYEHNGRLETYAMRIEALERSDGGAVVTKARITARREAQLELEEQRRELSYLARVSVLGELSGALAHELNQPLAAIRSNAEAALLLFRRSPPDLAEIGDILRDIINDDYRAAQVIHRLSALLRRGETRRQPIDTSELVNEVLELAHGELIARHVAVTAEVEPDPPSVLGDRVQLQQVLLNLILNGCEAMNATAAPDRRLFLRVVPEARDHVHLSLRDCGTGIAPGMIDRLFEPFVTTKPEGLGLGLSISRRIIAAHDGRLWAENNADRGATLHCVLPTAPG